jgi:hypothetical protein
MRRVDLVEISGRAKRWAGFKEWHHPMRGESVIHEDWKLPRHYAEGRDGDSYRVEAAI